MVAPRAGTPPLLAGAAVADAVTSLCARFPVRETALEDAPMNFRANLSSTTTRYTLARVNGVVAHAAWRASGGSPVALHTPSRVRAFFGLPKGSKGGAAAAAAAAAVPTAVIPAAAATTQAEATRMRLEGKDAVLRYVLACHPGLSLEADCEERGGEGLLLLPSLWPGVPPTAKYDRADALLLAMFALANRLEWQVLTDGGDPSLGVAPLFERIVSAHLLPSARLGRHGALEEADLPRLLAALRKQHADEIRAERRERLDESGGADDEVGGTGKEGEAPSTTTKAATKTKRKGKGKAEAGEEGKSGPVLERKMLSKLYWKLREDFSGACRVAMMLSDVLPWRPASEALMDNKP